MFFVCTAKFSETPLEMAYGREMNVQSQATALVDIPAVSMSIARSLKTCDILGIVHCAGQKQKCWIYNFVQYIYIYMCVCVCVCVWTSFR